MKILTFGCSVIAIVLFCDSLHAQRYGFKPEIVSPYLTAEEIKQNYNYCYGEYYLKFIKCEWVKKVKK